MSESNDHQWTSASHALSYLARADGIPHRTEGEGVLLELLPRRLSRVLDLGSGDGRLLNLVKAARPGVQGVALDFSETMLERLQRRFADDAAVQIVEHDLDHPLPPSLGMFDAIVSSFAIHHLTHDRKRALYGEIYDRLTRPGLFCNLEHVASPSASVHAQFLAAIDVHPDDEDASNKLLDVRTQLDWLKEIGFVDVDCYWKWRELALLAGHKVS